MSATIKCRAAVCWSAGEKLIIEEIEVAPPQKNEVRARVVATGLAGQCTGILLYLNLKIFNLFSAFPTSLHLRVK
jgi:hypothetical protein